MFTRHPTVYRPRNAISHVKTLATVGLAVAALPALAQARQATPEIDTITTGSIPSQAMLWTVDPSVILALLLVAFLGLTVAGFALARRSFKDAATEQQRQTHRPFD